MERRYASVLHRLVRRILAGGEVPLRAVLAESQEDEAAITHQLDPLLTHLSIHLAETGPCLDPRVFRRVARELWNSAAGVCALLC